MKLSAVILFASIGLSSSCSRHFILFNHDSSLSLATGTGVGSSPASKISRFHCSDPAVMASSDFRRLTKLELTNTLKVLLTDKFYPKIADQVAIFSEDTSQTAPAVFDNSFANQHIDSFKVIALQIADLFYNVPSVSLALVGNCASNLSQACVEPFIDSFGLKVLRRPVTASEHAGFVAAYTSAPSPLLGLRRIIGTLFQSPEFLYHVEVGADSGDSSSPFALSAYEIANRVAYQLTDNPPDAPLLAAASGNLLSTPGQIEPHVDRLLQSPAGHDKVRRLFNEWFAVGDNFQVSTIPAFDAGIDPTAYAAEASREWAEYVDFMVFNKKANYKEIMSSKRSFARTQALATVYNHPLAADPLTSIQTFGDERQGLLLRASFLASSATVTHPLVRGAMIQKNILCNALGDPPANRTPATTIDTDAPAYVSTHTTRERYLEKTNSPNCLGCHALINPTGFVLENFDPLGRIRSRENRYDDSGLLTTSFAIDAQSLGPVIDGANLPISGGGMLAEVIAQSEQGAACFSRQAFRFINLKNEDLNLDACRLNASFQMAYSGKGSIYDGLKATVLNPYLGLRRISP